MNKSRRETWEKKKESWYPTFDKKGIYPLGFIGKLYGIQRQILCNWAARYNTFPKPKESMVYFGVITAFYSLEEVEDWISSNVDMEKRRLIKISVRSKKKVIDLSQINKRELTI